MGAVWFYVGGYSRELVSSFPFYQTISGDVDGAEQGVRIWMDVSGAERIPGKLHEGEERTR
jgi:hypothetical protein